MGTKTFALEQPIALQLACISNQSMINYRTHATLKIGCKIVEEYFDITNVEHYDAILGTPLLRKMGIVLDFRSLGIIWMGNDMIPTGKVSFNELKDTNSNIATKGNVIQDSGAVPDREWSQEGELHTVFDLWEQNDNMVKDVTLFPDQDIIHNDMARAAYHSKLDMSEAYSDSQNWVNVWYFWTIHWIALNVKHI